MTDQTGPIQTVELPVKGMDCSGCVAAVTKALQALPGVCEVTVTLKDQKAVIRLDPVRVSRDTLRETVEDLGYETT